MTTNNDPQNVPMPQEGGVKPKRGIPANCRHGRDEVRFKMAEKAVEAGVPIPQAMRDAGYSKHTAKQNNNYPVKRALIKVRDNFMKAYTRNLSKKGLDGTSVSNRLAKIVNGKDDYNANQAIKTHVMILLKNAPSQDQSGGFLGVFLVPAAKDPGTWENDVRNLKQVNVSGMIQDAEVIEK